MLDTIPSGGESEIEDDGLNNSILNENESENILLDEDVDDNVEDEVILKTYR